MSAAGHNRTHAPQHKECYYSINSSARAKHPRGPEGPLWSPTASQCSQIRPNKKRTWLLWAAPSGVSGR